MGHQATTVVSAKPPAMSLEQEIQAAIAPYTQSRDKPPFSAPELALMAWVCCKNASEIVLGKQIFEWIVHSFAYYDRLAMQDKNRLGAFDRYLSLKFSLRPLLKSLTLATKFQSVPLYCVPNYVPYKLFMHDLKKQAYTSTQTASRMFLRRALGNEPQHFNHFFDLPAEIRMMIYKEVFFYREPLNFLNPTLQGHKARKIFEFTERGPRRSVDGNAVSSTLRCFKLGSDRDDPVVSSANVLSLLLVNRQIFAEAMPVFYSTNTFKAQDLCSLVRLLRQCGERRRAHFAHIHFSYVSFKSTTIMAAAELLAEVTHLQLLTVDPGHASSRYQLHDYHMDNWYILLLGVGTRSIDFLREDTLLEAFVREQQSMMKD